MCPPLKSGKMGFHEPLQGRDRVTGFFKDLLETFLFSILTLLLYGLFIFTFPVFRDPHGWIVMNDLPDISKTVLVERLLFGSACICAFLGALMLAWAPALTPGIMSNLWATTYFFIWFDSVFSLSIEGQTFQCLIGLGFGLLMIYLFFFALHYFAWAPDGRAVSVWKRNAVQYWVWGWIVIYFVLSCILAYRSLSDIGLQFPLALGTLIVCFLNYLLYLYLEKSEGKNIEGISRIGRLLFLLWTLALLFVWIGRQWIR